MNCFYIKKSRQQFFDACSSRESFAAGEKVDELVGRREVAVICVLLAEDVIEAGLDVEFEVIDGLSDCRA